MHYMQVLEMDSDLDSELEDSKTETPEEDNLSGVEMFLKSNGIRDGKTIIYESDNGTEEIDFEALDKSEQFGILKNLSRPDLDDHEIEAINYMRSNNVNLNQIIDYYVQQAVNSVSEPPTQHYEIDDYSDDEIFISHLTSSFPNLTEEEMIEELKSAKENPESFAKKIEIFKQDYIDQENLYIEEQQQMQLQQEQAFENTLIETARHFNEFVLDYRDPASESLTLEDDDKNTMLSYILDKDPNGITKFVSDLQKPEVLLDLA